MAKKEKKKPAGPSKEWMGTYGDMITLILCFFVLLYNPDESDPLQLAALTASLQGDPTAGGQSLSVGRLASLGNTINNMPSLEKGRSLGLAVKRAVSLFVPDIKSAKVTISDNERGLVITLTGDAFFKEGSAVLNIEDVRDTLMRLSQFFTSNEMKERKFRIEGHTDDLADQRWELSTDRAINVLKYLVDFGVTEKQFSVAGYADTRPKVPNDTPEGRAYNRRVDIIMIDDGHF
ncbi:MAG: OmpA family protein [Treponemataceae bacterium]